MLSNVLSFASDACVTHQPLVHGVPNGQSSIVFIPWFSWGTAVSKSTTVRLASSLFLPSFTAESISWSIHGPLFVTEGSKALRQKWWEAALQCLESNFLRFV